MPWEDNPDDRKNPKSGRKNPWGNADQGRPMGGNPPGPQGNRPEQANNSPQDDLYTMLRKAQDSFRGNGGNNNNAGGGFRLGPFQGAGLVILGVLIIWLLSGFYFVQPNENAVVTTFGKFDRIDEQPGLKFHFPSPFQSHQIVDVTTERRIEVGYREGVSRRSNELGVDVPDESLMLTGDENIIDIDFVVLWRVNNAKDFLYSIRDPEATIKIAAESAMREVIGRTKIQAALTEGRSQIQSDTRALAQKVLDEYKAGVSINNVQLQKVDPPGTVIDAFNDVQRARQEKEQLRNKAEAYRNDILPRARGEAEKLRQASEAYRAEVVSRSTGDAARFNSVYQAYQSAKSVTAERMYLETMEDVIKKAQTIVLDDQKGAALPYLSLNELRGRPNSVVVNPAATSQIGAQP